MYTDMENWAEIRRRVLVDGLGKRAACREYGIHWDTLQKILGHATPPGYRRAVPRPRPKIGPFLDVIRQILEDDRKAPKKQRHTAVRIFERLRDEHGYEGRSDRRQAGRRRLEEAIGRGLRPAGPPAGRGPGRLRRGRGHPRRPGRQGGDVRHDVAVLRRDLLLAFPRECTETFLEGHVRAFDFFGGVPRRISYDNLKIAVAKIVGGRDRKLTGEFVRLKSHYLFESHFCRVRRPNEKGHVEELVGYARRNFLVPVPAVWDGLESLNAVLEARCRADLERTTWGKPTSKAERLEEERPALLPPPAEAFTAARVEPRSVDSLSLVSFECNDYSVPTEYRLSRGDGRRDGGSGPHRVGRPRRRDPPSVLGPRAGHLRPGPLPGPARTQARALDFATPLAGWELPDCFGILRRRLEAELAGAGTREYIKVLRLLEWADPGELTGAVERALDLGTPDADAVRLILEHRRERPVGLFSLDGRPHLKSVAVPIPDLSAYAACAGVAS